MYKRCSGLVFVIVALAAVGLTASARADTVLFSDNFDGANYNDGYGGLNDNLVARQAGGLSSYTWGLGYLNVAGDNQVNNPTYGTGVMSLGHSGTHYQGMAIINHDFATDTAITAGGGFTVRYDIDPGSLGSSGATSTHNYGGGVYVGGMSADGSHDGSGRTAYYDPHGDVWANMADNGVSTDFCHNVWLNYPPFYTADSAHTPVGGNPGSVYYYLYSMELRIATTGFAAGGTATGSLWWGPQGTPSASMTQIPLGTVSMPGKSDGGSFNFTWDADGTNYIGFGCDGMTSRSAFDNISVSAWSSLLPGDANGDGTVNGADLNTVLSNYNQPGGWAQGDFNGDGAVNGSDLNTVLSNYNQHQPVEAAVPEPSTLWLAAAGLAGLWACARRKMK